MKVGIIGGRGCTGKSLGLGFDNALRQAFAATARTQATSQNA